jgi:hypothetical protein
MYISAIRCGGRDRNWRCGHSRSLERSHLYQGVIANSLNTPTKTSREVLAANSYRDHRAKVQNSARSAQHKNLPTVRSNPIFISWVLPHRVEAKAIFFETDDQRLKHRWSPRIFAAPDA